MRHRIETPERIRNFKVQESIRYRVRKFRDLLNTF